MFSIAVIDGQGGGIGSLIVKRLREEFGDTVEIIALGTNSAATAAMMKARADRGATGENAIAVTARRVDVIAGTLSVIVADSMMGEFTHRMAAAVAASDAWKVLIPLHKEKVEVVGVLKEPLPHMVDKLVEAVKSARGRVPIDAGGCTPVDAGSRTPN